MEEWIKKSDVLEMLCLPPDILKEYIYELKGVWVDEDWSNDKWIPCSEKLPEKSGTYIVTGAWKGQQRETWMCELYVLEPFGAGWCNDARRPIIDAWMPLPEPYKK